MELEFHQLELRYVRLKVARPETERRLLTSLAEVGQQVPVVVVEPRTDKSSFVVIDGYKRVRALRRLGRDTVRASCWPGEEAEALIVTRLMQTAERVRRGEIGAHGAATYLVPLARANRQVCLDLVQATGTTRLSSRDLGILYTAYQAGNWLTRQRLLGAPLAFLKSHKQMQAAPAIEPGQGDSLLSDLEIIRAAARRADRRLRAGILRNLPEKDCQDLARVLDQARHEIERLAKHLAEEIGHAGSKHAQCDSEAAPTGT